MRSHFVEAGNGVNWGKFLVGLFDAEDAALVSAVSGRPLLAECGWGGPGSLVGRAWVFDVQTGEGAYFALGGYSKADLDKHQVWVCVLFEPFLEWLYEHYKKLGPTWFDDLPTYVELPAAPGGLYGHRRVGPLVVWGSECRRCNNATHGSQRCDDCGQDDRTTPLYVGQTEEDDGER